MSPTRAQRELADRKRQKWNEAFTLIGLGLALGSWGYSVIAPEPSFWFGTLLLGLGLLASTAGACRVFELSKGSVAAVSLLVMAGFAYFDYKVLYEPHRDKEIKALLVQGYHIVDECSMRPYHDTTPTWMEDAQQRWVGAVTSFVESKLAAEYVQRWSAAKLVGLVADKDTNGYRCTDMSNKVAALETIVSEGYDAKIKHRPYNGPTYVFHTKDGKVDVSDAFKNGNKQANIVIDGGTTQPEKK